MIINSLLDTDFYKFTMGQFAWKYYPNIKVKYAFINRTKKVKLAEHVLIHELIEELDQVRNLKLTMDELNYLNELGIFSKGYLNFLSILNLPPVYVSEKDGELVIETEGLWCEAIFWETFILSIVNEMYYKTWKRGKAGYIGTYQENTIDKIEGINANPFKFVEFGTRRRFSREVQSTVLRMMQEGLRGTNTLIGTSNVWLAKNFQLKPIGTMAHELPMVCAGLHDESLYTLEHSHDRMLSQWWFMYKEELSIALTDTFGTDFFFRDFSQEKAETWKGLRQDSGDPIEFFFKALEFYEDYNIDPKEKLIIFSDGLTIDKIYEIEKAVDGRMKTAYGWGTNLTNDVGAEPLSIVVKAVEANGRPLVKLSDNTAKALGKPKIIEKYKKAFGYESTYNEPLYY